MEEGGLIVTFHMEHTNTRNGSPSSSSPPTPPSPLPVSVGPGNLNYHFSSSPSPSPPFSPSPPPQNLPLLSETLDTAAQLPSAFSLDRPRHHQLDNSTTSCLQDLLEWFIQKCCNCCSKSP